jgi:hypothetical protein
MNRQIIYVFIMQIVLCLFCGMFHAIWFAHYEDDKEWYLGTDSFEGGAGV